MPEYTLSAGSYSGLKYWSVTDEGRQLVVQPGKVRWTTGLPVQAGVAALGFGLMWVAWHFADREMVILMSLPVSAAVLGCIFIPILQVRNERSKGKVLIYDREREIVELPRKRLSLRKSQIAEFRILQEYGGPSFDGPAELQIVYRNPNETTASLLRGGGCAPFDDVVKALKTAELGRIVLAKQQADRQTWIESLL